MNLVARTLAPAALVAVGAMSAAPIGADDNGFFGQRNAYVVTPGGRRQSPASASHRT